MVVAGLAAEGETVISGVHHIDRGYDDLVGRLRAVGADIDADQLRAWSSGRDVSARRASALLATRRRASASQRRRTRAIGATTEEDLVPSALVGEDGAGMPIAVVGLTIGRHRTDA